MGTQHRFAYFYFMQGQPEQIQATAPRHAAYWKERGLGGYQGGPFTDRSGGLITFIEESMDRATRIVADDPFVVEGVIADSWVKEWTVE